METHKGLTQMLELADENTKTVTTVFHMFKRLTEDMEDRKIFGKKLEIIVKKFSTFDVKTETEEGQ